MREPSSGLRPCLLPLLEAIFVYGHFVKMRKWTRPLSARWLPHLFILVSPLQMETVTKILIKMRRLSTDGAILILVFCMLNNFIANVLPSVRDVVQSLVKIRYLVSIQDSLTPSFLFLSCTDFSNFCNVQTS